MFWLEAVNYLEHYGLRRLKDKDGVYESIKYQHSWSAVSSPVSFRIQRHSDHHAHSFRPYQILRRFDKTPTHPYEYILMLWLMVCPPMWFLVMDPRVDSINDAKNQKKNPNQWNRAMKMSEQDKQNHKIAMIYFAFVSIVFTYITFFLLWSNEDKEMVKTMVQQGVNIFNETIIGKVIEF